MKSIKELIEIALGEENKSIFIELIGEGVVERKTNKKGHVTLIQRNEVDYDIEITWDIDDDSVIYKTYTTLLDFHEYATVYLSKDVDNEINNSNIKNVVSLRK